MSMRWSNEALSFSAIRIDAWLPGWMRWIAVHLELLHTHAVAS